jgi:glutamate-1-semialdehyde 2,1-aminomutase
MNSQKSRELFERLQRVMPGANTRSTTHYEPYPIAIDRGSGCRIWDVDGNEYIDLLNNYTPLVHGHAAPRIVEAIVRAAENEGMAPAPTLYQAELAERICQRTPSIELLRFTNSGTEAVLMACRAARAFTGRDELIMPAEGYHGGWEQVALHQVEVGESEEGPEESAQAIPGGIPPAVARLMHFVRYNDVAHLEELMREHGERVAAIIMEPVIGHTLQVGEVEFVEAAQRLAREHGALLILDEVVTSRLHVGGWQVKNDIRPDLTTLGKTIGGGLPVGAFGGRADVMGQFDPRRPDAVMHHGTLSGNMLTMAAGIACLDMLDQEAIDRINALGKRLAEAFAAAARAAGADMQVRAVGSLLHVTTPAQAAFHAACLDEGLYIAPRGSMNVSTVMDEGVLEEAGEKWKRALGRLDW